eukprot:3038891-Pleurochrysis_carterae.AAC.3
MLIGHSSACCRNSHLKRPAPGYAATGSTPTRGQGKRLKYGHVTLAKRFSSVPARPCHCQHERQPVMP